MAIVISAAIDRIVLMGFMGAGKTTIGKLLAQELGWKFADLDAIVEQRCGRSVPEIFAELGEEHFRSEESHALRSLMGEHQMILALGGGTTEHPSNQCLLRNATGTAAVYLQAPFADLQDRCSRQAAQPGSTVRPLLSDHAAALLRFEARLPKYQELATLCVETRNRTAQEVADTILLQLR